MTETPGNKVLLKEMHPPAALDNGLVVEVESARFEEVVVTAPDALLSATASQ